MIVVPVVGALLIGLMARYGSKANRSRIPARVTVLKPLSAAISIGTGGPFGAEGPIIATGGALGSLLGQIFSVTGVERKILLAAGAAAGMTAIFGSPVSAVLLAVELLLFEFSSRSTIPVALACATAAGLRLYFFSAEPIFAMPEVAVSNAPALLAFLVLGGVVGLAAAIVSRAVYWVEDQFERLPVHWMWWPAIGAVGVGAIGIVAPRTLGVGYDNIEDIVAEALPLSLIAWLCGMKLLSWLIALGSGTSGGTLAPLLTIGAGLGAVLAAGGNALGLEISLGVAALVGMSAMFAGASRALLASVVFAFETTLQPNALPALLAGATAAHLIARLVTRHSIMTERISRRGLVVPNSYLPDPLAHMQVGAVMSDDFQTLPASLSAEELAHRISAHDPEVSRRQACLLADPEGLLAGIVTRGDLLKCAPGATLLQAGSSDLVVAYPDESVAEVLARMFHHDIGRLPVVSRESALQAVGYLGRAEILVAQRAGADGTPESGWLEEMRRKRREKRP
ncbi:MAG: chloride channel protein [Verrucomicrobiaceae bacterium]|nr:chloride channel protein [Verrucomicrobiaceae bacterium]